MNVQFLILCEPLCYCFNVSVNVNFICRIILYVLVEVNEKNLTKQRKKTDKCQFI